MKKASNIFYLFFGALIVCFASTAYVVFSSQGMQNFSQAPKGTINDKPLLSIQQKIQAKESGFASFRDSEGWNVVHISNMPSAYL